MKDIRRATRKQYSAEDKIRIVLDGLRGEDSRSVLYEHARGGEALKFTKVGHRTVVLREDAEAWLRRLRNANGSCFKDPTGIGKDPITKG